MLPKPNTHSDLYAVYRLRKMKLNPLTVTASFGGIQAFLSSSAVIALILKLGYAGSKSTTRRVYKLEQITYSYEALLKKHYSPIYQLCFMCVSLLYKVPLSSKVVFESSFLKQIT